MSAAYRYLGLLALVMLAACPPDNGVDPVVPPPPPPPPPPAAPSAPTNLVATAVSSSQVTLSWTDASTNEDGFAIERCAGAGCSNFAAWNNAPANATGYHDITVVGGTSYSYRVRASNNVGTSAFSNTSTAVTMAAGAIPGPPTSPAATAFSSSRIDITWTDASTNEDGFRIERCQGAGCTNFLLVATTLTPNGASWSSTGLTASTTYRFRIQSYNGSGGSAFAGPVSATTNAAAAAPAAPSGLTATAASSSRINLTWTDNANNEDEFLIERCQGAGCSNFQAFASVTPNTMSYADNGRSASTSYSYRVRAGNGAGGSNYSNTATAVTLASVTAPAAPSAFAATPISSTQINLSWTDNSSNEDDFRIERCQGAGCSNFALLATAAANATGYSNTGLTAGTSYSYRIQARNGGGTSSFASATAATPSAPPQAPTGFTATAASSSVINLAWTDASNNEDGFRIERCGGANCTNYTLVTNTAANATSYSNTGLTASATYRYRIQSFNAGGSSSPVGPATATTSPATATPPAAPTNLAANPVSSTQVNLSWTDASNNEDGFRVERCTGASCTNYAEVITLAAGATSYNNTGLSASTTYRYRVVAFNSGGSSAAGPVSASTPPALSTPVLNSPSVSGMNVTLTWTFTWPAGLASSADHYDLEVSTTSGTSGFSLLSQYYERTSPKTVTVTRAAGTHWFRVRAFTTQGTTGYSSAQSATVAATTTPTTLRIVNDLPGTVNGPNDWGKLNTVIRVRIGPTQSSVLNFTTDARELLFNGDYTSNVAWTYDIAPGESMTFDVSDRTGEYWLFIQTGWWDYNANSQLYEKHLAAVVGCSQQTTYKYTTIRVYAPYGNPEIIQLSQFLPQGNWYGSPFCP